MKTISAFLIAGLLLGSLPSFGQLSVDKGTKFLNVGIGFGGWGGLAFGGRSIALGASAELGLRRNISVGPLVGFQTYRDVGSWFSVGGRGSYHFNELLRLSDNKLDLYAGLGLIYSGFTYSNEYRTLYRSLGIGNPTTYGGIDIGGHLGARYFFNEKIGGFAEAGFGVAPLQLGLTARF